jgi:hypothetical protein
LEGLSIPAKSGDGSMRQGNARLFASLNNQAFTDPRKAVDDIIKGKGPWGRMPRNELYTGPGSNKFLVEQVACSSAMKVPERLNAKIDKASYTPH